MTVTLVPNQGYKLKFGKNSINGHFQFFQNYTFS